MMRRPALRCVADAQPGLQFIKLDQSSSISWSRVSIQAWSVTSAHEHLRFHPQAEEGLIDTAPSKMMARELMV
jgi:hypothetical protein